MNMPWRLLNVIGATAACVAAMGADLTTTAAPLNAPGPARRSGIDAGYFDNSVRVQDDFCRHVNGGWLDTVAIPADKGRYGSFDKLIDDTEDQLHAVMDALLGAADPSVKDQRKLTELYASMMDEPRLERLGLRPLRGELARIAALRDRGEIPALIAHLSQIGVNAPCTPRVHQDARDPNRYVFDLRQSGLGMPDRDYYLQDTERLQQVRRHYGQHIEALLRLGGDAAAAAHAHEILALETALAALQWTRVDNRNPVKTYNKVPLDQLASLAPGFDWPAYLQAAGVSGRVDYLVVSQPSYLSGFSELLRHVPVSVWRSYFRWRLLSDYAPYLSRRLVEEDFAFQGTALRGIQENKPRWKRAIGLVDESIGESLGRVYVARYFPPESKARMDQLVSNLLAAYRTDIDTLAWMSPETRQRAQAKLAKITVKIGYPDHWRDYSELVIRRSDLVGNVMRAREFAYHRDLNKLGHPIDRSEWDMTPQTVNAYYNPQKNEIVFPAAILQPPFFNVQADDAVNYGGIGAVIGHEISHGFDDQGSQYDGDGVLLDPPGWFTAEDLARFKARTHALVEQYAAHAPVPGYPINGELTLGENIADNSGLAIAYRAYQISQAGAEAPVIDGLSGPQRFYLGWAQAWREKCRDSEAILRIKSDPHSPAQFRGALPAQDQATFYEAFGIHVGDRMYQPPAQRVQLW